MYYFFTVNRVVYRFLIICICWFYPLIALSQLEPSHVAVIYNSHSESGKELALEYMRLRSIPLENLVELRCSNQEEIGRGEYERTIVMPLKRIARERKWWAFSKNRNTPFEFRKIHALVLMKGMPLKISHQKMEAHEKTGAMETNAASVDSELSLFFVDNAPIKGMLPNPYFDQDQGFVGSQLPLVLIGRIDAPTVDACRRMMRDAVEVEKKGLWGWAVIDKGGPHAEGDQWLDAAIKSAESNGMPLMVDTWPQTIAPGYPLMRDIAVYLGWYAGAINGPFREEGFRFKKGAVACHIHSFSASTIRGVHSGWSGPLIERGAAVTVGNVNEPFLGGSHHVHLFFDRLLKGYSVAEAAAMSIPVLSWQGIVLGDPLYRPFAVRKDGGISKDEDDKYFQAWWLINKEWGSLPDERLRKLDGAAAKTEGRSFMWEALAYEAFRAGWKGQARKYMDRALRNSSLPEDQARLEMEMARMDRREGNDDVMLRSRMDSLMVKYRGQPCVKAMEEWKKRGTPPLPKENEVKNGKK